MNNGDQCDSNEIQKYVDEPFCKKSVSVNRMKTKSSYMNIKIESNIDKESKAPWHKSSASKLISVNMDKVIKKKHLSRDKTNESQSSQGDKKVNTLRGTGGLQKMSTRKKISEHESQLLPLVDLSQNLSPFDYEMKDVYSNQIHNKIDMQETPI